MDIVIAAIQTILLLCLAGPVLYLLLLMTAATFYRNPYTRSNNNPARPDRWAILIPAHNEALTLPAALKAIKALDRPVGMPEPLIVVVADNCSDNTAALAQQAGVMVLERENAEKRGKGYALEYGLDFLLLAENQIEFSALVIFDADTLPDPHFLEETYLAFQDGNEVLQGCYDILKPAESGRTRLLYLAFLIYNQVRPLGRSALGLSDGLRGNGMVFSRKVLQEHRWQAYGLVEDIEYANRLVLNGRRVVYVPKAKLYGQAPGTNKAATTQRMRWEGGRFKQARHDLPSLLKRSFTRADFNAFDRAMDLLIPPLALLAMLLVGFTVLNYLLWVILGGSWLGLTLWGWVALNGGLGLFVVGSLVIARPPAWAFLALLSAPFYILWKAWIYLQLLAKRGPKNWERTQRARLD